MGLTMTWPTPASLEDALIGARLRYRLAPGWDDRALSPYDPADVSCDYGILHHTAGTDSLGWMVHNEYAPVRACHFLINRAGTVDVVTAWPCYHAGSGGPGAWGAGPLVPADVMNQHAYGVEIESKGTSLEPVNGNGYTPAQVTTTAALAAAICHMNRWPASRWVNHKTWAPGRKGDTLQTDAWWQERINAALNPTSPMMPTPQGDPVTVVHVTATAAPGQAGDYLLVGDKLLGVTAASKAASHLPAPEFTVADPEQWSRVLAAFGPPIT